ncbi:putative DD41D transposase [Trichonephila clavipes]|nr:putative DD41D transposase [Trichonephila clavipes]
MEAHDGTEHVDCSVEEKKSDYCDASHIKEFSPPHLLKELWFQQDGATCHTARATIDLLKGTFGDRLISRFEPVNWPPRSCDLTPLDYFLWGYVKPLVYADEPQTLDHLEDNIRRVIADMRPQMLEKVIENWTSKLDYIRASRGSLMPEIIFKYKCRLNANEICLEQGALLNDPNKCNCTHPFRYSKNGITCERMSCSDADVKKECSSKGAICVDDWRSGNVVYKCVCPFGQRFNENEKCSGMFLNLVSIEFVFLL